MGTWRGHWIYGYAGTAYAVGALLNCVESREGGGTLYIASLLPMLGDPSNPDDWITVQLIVNGDVLLCPYGWESNPDAYLIDIPEGQWVEMATGARCVMIDGWPYQPQGSAEPDERPGSVDD